MEKNESALDRAIDIMVRANKNGLDSLSIEDFTELSEKIALLTAAVQPWVDAWISTAVKFAEGTQVWFNSLPPDIRADWESRLESASTSPGSGSSSISDQNSVQ